MSPKSKNKLQQEQAIERKKISDCRGSIIRLIANPIQEDTANKVEALLKGVSNEVLSHVLNDDVGLYPLETACGLLLISPSSKNNDKKQLVIDNLKKCILLLLEYGASPDLNHQGLTPLQVLFMDASNAPFPVGYKYPYYDCVEALVKKGASLTVKDQNQMNVVHLASICDVKSMKMILDSVSIDEANRLIEEPNLKGETAIFNTIRYENTNAACELLSGKYTVDVNKRNYDGASVFSAAMFYINPFIAYKLLEKGAIIGLDKGGLIAETTDQDSTMKVKNLLKVLLKSGYFLRLKDKALYYPLLKKHFDITVTEEMKFLFMLESPKTKVIKIISSVEDLVDVESMEIEKNQLTILKRSIYTVVNHLRMKAKSSLDTYDQLMSKLDELFPTDNSAWLTVESILGAEKAFLDQASPQTSSQINLEYFSVMLEDSIKYIDNDIVINQFIMKAKKLLWDCRDHQVSVGVLFENIKLYNKKFHSSMSAITNSTRPENYMRFISKMNYYFISSHISRLLNQINSQRDLELMSGEIEYLLIITAVQLMDYDDKSFHYVYDMLIQLIHKYTCYNATVNKVTTLSLITYMLTIHGLVKMGEPIQIVDVLNDILSDGSITKLVIKELRSKELVLKTGALLDRLERLLLNFVNNLNVDSITITDNVSIESKIRQLSEEFAFDTLLKVCDSYRERVVRECYLPMLNDPALELASLTYEKTELFNVVIPCSSELKLRIQFDPEIVSVTKLRAHFKSYPLISEIKSNGCFIHFYGMTKEEIAEAINLFRSSQADTLKKGTSQPAEASPDSSASQNSTVNDSDYLSKYAAPTLFSYNSASSSSNTVQKEKGKAKTSLQDEAQKCSAERLAREKKFHDVQVEIATKVGVPEENVFHIHNRLLKEDKQYLSWGYWGEISGDRTTVEALYRHKVVAQRGTVVKNHKGETGLKFVGFDKIKTKVIADGEVGDMRVVAEQQVLHSDTLNKDLKVFAFGRVTHHK